MRASSSSVACVLVGAFLALVARFALPAFAARAFAFRDVFAIGLLLAVLGVTPSACLYDCLISSGPSSASAGTGM
jgi:hypothetical protein